MILDKISYIPHIYPIFHLLQDGCRAVLDVTGYYLAFQGVDTLRCIQCSRCAQPPRMTRHLEDQMNHIVGAIYYILF